MEKWSDGKTSNTPILHRSNTPLVDCFVSAMAGPKITTTGIADTPRVSSLHRPLLRKPGGDAGLTPPKYSSNGKLIQHQCAKFVQKITCVRSAVMVYKE